MHPTSPLFPLFLSLLLLRHLAHADCEAAACPNLTVKYPFWIDSSHNDSSPFSCGHPSFRLSCNSDGTAFLKDSYIHVLHINYTNNSLVASHSSMADAPNDTCPPTFNVSSSIALSPFKISRSNRVLSFLQNCSGTKPLDSYPVTCRRNGMFVHLGGNYGLDNPPVMPGRCESYSYLPVLGSTAAIMTAANYTRLLKDGFLLEWEARFGDCSACNARGGRCRYDVGALVFACLCSDGRLHGPTCPNGRHRSKLILIVSLSATTSLLLTCLVWIIHRKKRKLSLFLFQKYTGNESSTEEILKRYQSLAPKMYKYSELKKITRSFKDKLGEGGYGMVFKGSLKDGRIVAVKLLKDSKGNGEEFLNEVISIGRTSHVNIVSLLGFCLQGSKRALVYQYMANGSLEKYIYLENSKLAIGWEKLQEIAIGIARGLEYLHQGCNIRIIHFDIKPHNILLDQDFCPKIADFGLAKLCHHKDSAISMAEARGTIGFIAPEVFCRGFGVISIKSDVYSYGMMLLEMAGGKKNMKENHGNSSEVYFPKLIYDQLARELHGCEVRCETEEIVRKMTLVGLWCIQMNPGNRPSISTVIEMLEGNISELEMPPEPLLSSSSLPSYFSS